MQSSTHANTGYLNREEGKSLDNIIADYFFFLMAKKHISKANMSDFHFITLSDAFRHYPVDINNMIAEYYKFVIPSNVSFPMY